MHDFDYDVMQKKRIASGAAHRKRGAKSKKCTLPHENLTKKELKALSGEVKTYNIHERLTWAKFKELDDDVAAEHIKFLVDTFGANIHYIAVALGVSDFTVSQYLKAHGIKVKKRVFIETPEWLAFMGVPVELMLAPVEAEPAVAEPAVDEAETAASSPSVQLLRGNLVLTGPKGLVLQRLFEVLPDSVTVDVGFSAEGASKSAWFL